VNSHDILKISAGVLALVLYLPLIRSAWRDNGAGHSFAMWALWAVLDTTITISLILRDGNFWLTAGFAAGSIILSLALLAKGRFTWGGLETVVLLLVLACLAIWKFSGPRRAIVATTLAIFIAGLPGLIELWKNPQPSVARIWLGYTIANLMAFLGGSTWTLEERFAPSIFAVQTLALTVVGYRTKPRSDPMSPPGCKYMKLW